MDNVKDVQSMTALKDTLSDLGINPCCIHDLDDASFALKEHSKHKKSTFLKLYINDKDTIDLDFPTFVDGLKKSILNEAKEELKEWIMEEMMIEMHKHHHKPHHKPMFPECDCGDECDDDCSCGDDLLKDLKDKIESL